MAGPPRSRAMSGGHRRQIPAGAVTRHHEVLRSPNPAAHRVDGVDVFGRRGPSMFRRQPVIDRNNHGSQAHWPWHGRTRHGCRGRRTRIRRHGRTPQWYSARGQRSCRCAPPTSPAGPGAVSSLTRRPAPVSAGVCSRAPDHGPRLRARSWCATGGKARRSSSSMRAAISGSRLTGVGRWAKRRRRRARRGGRRSCRRPARHRWRTPRRPGPPCSARRRTARGWAHRRRGALHRTSWSSGRRG